MFILRDFQNFFPSFFFNFLNQKIYSKKKTIFFIFMKNKNFSIFSNWLFSNFLFWGFLFFTGIFEFFFFEIKKISLKKFFFLDFWKIEYLFFCRKCLFSHGAKDLADEQSHLLEHVFSRGWSHFIPKRIGVQVYEGTARVSDLSELPEYDEPGAEIYELDAIVMMISDGAAEPRWTHPVNF